MHHAARVSQCCSLSLGRDMVGLISRVCVTQSLPTMCLNVCDWKYCVLVACLNARRPWGANQAGVLLPFCTLSPDCAISGPISRMYLSWYSDAPSTVASECSSAANFGRNLQRSRCSLHSCISSAITL